MRRFLARCSNLFRRRAAEREMSREIESHLALLREDFERRGLPSAEAALAARRAYGGVEQSRELHREARSFLWVEQLAKDVRYGWQNLLRNPGFTLVAVLALTLGIGVNAAIFGIYNAIVLKPLPVDRPSRIVRLKRWFAQNHGEVQYYFTEEEYRYLRDRSTMFSSIVISDGGDGGDGISALATAPHLKVRAQLKGGHAVSANYFATLGVKPILGRAFLPDEDRAPGANPVVILDYRLWQRSFGGDPGILGQVVELNGEAYTIVGVGPQKFNGTDMSMVQSDFWVPISMRQKLDPRSQPKHSAKEAAPRALFLIARLKSGVSRERAQAETDLLLRQYLAGRRESDRTLAVTLQGVAYFDYAIHLSQFQTNTTEMAVLVGLVLLVACANVTNMLLARGAARQREIAVRMALGAGRGRVVRQLLTESLLLALLGGAMAIPLSAWAGRLLYRSLIAVMRGFHFNLIEVDLSPDVRMFACGLFLSLLAAILFGLAPALRLTRLDLSAAMKDEAGVFGARLSRSRLRGLLLGAQVAMSVMLLMTSGLLMAAVSRARAADPGYDTRQAFLLMTDSTQGNYDYDTDPQAAQRLRERIRTLPEVTGTVIGGVPLGGDTIAPPMSVGKQSELAIVSHHTDGYFETLGIRLVRGRDFTPQEAAHRAPVSVISEATARFFWPGQNPLGQRFTLHLVRNPFKDATDFEVIGVAKDVRDALIDRLDDSHVYLPTDGSPDTYEGGLMFRIQGDREKALAAVQREVEAMDRNLLPGLNLVNLEEGPVTMYRNLYGVLATFSGALTMLALALAAVGIYGVMAFLVSQRTREIGIRMALGATPPTLVRTIAVQGLLPVLIGMAIGFPAAAWIYALIDATTSQDSLFLDPWSYGLLALMLAIAATASVVPARRAMRVDPAEALRHE